MIVDIFVIPRFMLGIFTTKATLPERFFRREFGAQGREFGAQGREFGAQGREFGAQGREFEAINSIPAQFWKIPKK